MPGRTNITGHRPAQPLATTARAEDPNVKELKTKVGKLVEKKFGGNYRKAFDHYEASGDKGIDKAETKTLLKDSKVGNVFTRGAWANGVLDHFDKNNNRKIEWGEFQAGIKPQQ